MADQEPPPVARLSKLDDEDYPAFTIGQAASILGVREAFVRSLDAARILTPHRSEGGHRRYSRRQLARIARLREQLDEGHSLAAANRIIDLEDELDRAESTINELHNRLRDQEAVVRRYAEQHGTSDAPRAEHRTDPQHADPQHADPRSAGQQTNRQPGDWDDSGDRHG